MAPAKTRTILIPTDFSEPAAQALRYGVRLAKHLGARLHVLYVEPLSPLADSAPSTLRYRAETIVQAAREQLIRHVEENVDRAVLFDLNVTIDMPADGILRVSRDSGADLIVMGTHGRTGFRRFIVGSVTEEVMRLASTPVLAVPPQMPEGFSLQSIVCPITYTAESYDALETAAAIANDAARFFVIRGIHTDDLPETIKEIIDLKEWVPRRLASRCDYKVMPGKNLAEQVVRFARTIHADLIAVSEPLNRTAGDVLQGTFAERVVQHAGCPVLSVNASTAAATISAEWEEVAAGL